MPEARREDKWSAPWNGTSRKPNPVSVITIGEDLTKLSVRELDERVALMKAEIVRLEAAASAKRKTTAAAAALFGKE